MVDHNQFIAYCDRGDVAKVVEALEHHSVRLDEAFGPVFHSLFFPFTLFFLKKQMTPLMQAASRGHSTIVSLLLRHGADVYKQNDEGETALHLACYHGHVDVCDLLCSQSTTSLLNTTTKEGETCLFYACRKGHGTVVRMLLGRGADTAVENQYDEQAIDQSSKASIADCIRRHEQAQRSSSSDILVAGEEGTASLIFCSQSILRHICSFLPLSSLPSFSLVNTSFHLCRESKFVFLCLLFSFSLFLSLF